MDNPHLWWVLAGIISCGTLAGPLIMEFTKIFVSTQSRHVREITTASGQGGASLNILSGFVAGNFCAFWMGLVIITSPPSPVSSTNRTSILHGAAPKKCRPFCLRFSRLPRQPG